MGMEGGIGTGNGMKVRVEIATGLGMEEGINMGMEVGVGVDTGMTMGDARLCLICGTGDSVFIAFLYRAGFCILRLRRVEDHKRDGENNKMIPR